MLLYKYKLWWRFSDVISISLSCFVYIFIYLNLTLDFSVCGACDSDIKEDLHNKLNKLTWTMDSVHTSPVRFVLAVTLRSCRSADHSRGRKLSTGRVQRLRTRHTRPARLQTRPGDTRTSWEPERHKQQSQALILNTTRTRQI